MACADRKLEMDVNSRYYALLVLQKLEPTVFAKHALAHMMDAMCFDDADPFLSRNAAVIVVERFDLAVNKQEHHVGAVETMLNVLRECPVLDNRVPKHIELANKNI